MGSRGNELVQAALRGERDACARLVRENYEGVYRFLAHLSGERTAAEDLTQETFAAAWKGLKGFRGEASFVTWLHRIAYTKYVTRARRNRNTNG